MQPAVVAPVDPFRGSQLDLGLSPTIQLGRGRSGPSDHGMGDPRAFISFDFDHDEAQRNLFVGQARRDSPTPFVVEDWSSKEVLPEREWEAMLRRKISRCDLVIVLVGRYMASAGGVVKEIGFAASAGVPVFGVYVDGANSSSNLPAGLPRNRVIVWTWPAVAAAIEQMMREGR